MKKSRTYEAERWLKQAKADLETANVLIEGKRYYMACFLCQQVAEKALKAYLYRVGEEFVFGHSVSKLCIECSEYDSNFLNLRKKIKNLDQFYVEARYPNGLPDGIPADFFDENDAHQGFEKAKITIEFVQSLIEQLAKQEKEDEN